MQAIIARHITLHDISMAIFIKISVLITNKYKEKREMRKEKRSRQKWRLKMNETGLSHGKDLLFFHKRQVVLIVHNRFVGYSF
jgi:hypothetical protein